MAYAAFSVVFGETPSAAKWNILGTNDAEFNSMIHHTAGGLTTLNDVRYQNENSLVIASSTQDNVLKQYGWGQITGDGTANIIKTVTFPTEFDTVLWAASGAIARSTSATVAASSITDLTVGFTSEAVSCSYDDLTTTTMRCILGRSDGGGFTSGAEYGFWWEAIGNKA